MSLKYPNGTVAHEDMKRSALEELRKRDGGMTMRQIQKRFGIDANLEENRVRVWRLVSAMVGLQREKFVIRSIENSQAVFYAVS